MGSLLYFFITVGIRLSNPSYFKTKDRVSIEENPALKELFQLYQDSLIRNKHAETLNLVYYYKGKKSIWKKLGFGK